MVDSIANGSLKHFEYSSQIAEHTPAKETLETFWFNSNSANVNLPPAFIQALQITAEDEVTAEIITTSDGRKGILLAQTRRAEDNLKIDS